MEYRLEKGDQGQYRIVGLYTESEVLSAWKKAAEHFAASVQVPGFRRGKAPLSVMEKQFGEEMAELATDRLVDKVLEKALASEKLIPMTGMEYEGELARRGAGLSFELSFGTLPEFELPDLSVIAVDASAPEADSVQENLFLREMLARGAEKVNVTEGKPQEGDLVSAEVVGRVDGREVPGLAGPIRMRLVAPALGEKVPDLDPILRGLNVGETGVGKTLCPGDFPDIALRGRPIELTVTLHSIERDILPVLDDETARRLGFRNAEAMRFRAHEQALEMERLHKRSKALQAIRSVLEEWPGFEAPEAMVKQCTREAIQRAAQHLQQQAAHGALSSVLSQMEEEAAAMGVRKARCRTLLLGWARANGVNLPQNEADAVLRGRAARRQMSLEEYLLSTARSGEARAVCAAMLEEKALYALYDAIVQAQSPAAEGE